MNKTMAMLVAGAGFVVYGLVKAQRQYQSDQNQCKEFDLEVYPPHTDELTELLTAAAPAAEVPSWWGGSHALHDLIFRESKGWVGIPNYTYGQGDAGKKWGSNISNPKNRHKWKGIHEELKRGIKGARSTATGIGQHILGNTERYYPDGSQGIGDAYNEAVGFLRYVKERYKTPENALAFRITNNWY